MKISKSKILMGLPIAMLSIQAYIGTLFGYFSAKVLSKKVPSLILNLGNYKLHLHHWLVCLVTIIFTFSLDLSFFLNPLYFGFFGGLIFQGISDYPDWCRILIKK